MIVTMETIPPAADHPSEWADAGKRATVANRRAGDLREQLHDVLVQRDRAIREAVDAGASIRSIARTVGVSKAAIYNIMGTEPA